MSNPTPVTAIFDIGKTNKKCLLFDESLDLVYNNHISLPETVDEDGDPCEDLPTLVSWIYNQLEDIRNDSRFTITALNFSTYGASFVHLNEAGQVLTPLYNYLKPYPESLLQTFYEKYGPKEEFAHVTASPPMGMLNSGLQLYWLKHTRPEIFREIRYSLHFPHYLSYLFTGKPLSELTSIGCHTAMWNFRNNRYHEWLTKEGLTSVLPDIKPVTHTSEGIYKSPESFGSPGYTANTVTEGSYDDVKMNGSFSVGSGIHDSSSSLVPYLYSLEERFLLLSTGTWNIAMNPFNSEPLTFSELNRDCLCYINLFGEPVKSSRFFLGHEYAFQKQKLKEFFGRDTEIKLDTSLLKACLENRDSGRKLSLATAYPTGPWPQTHSGTWRPENFESYEEAMHQLLLDLVSIQADSVRLALGSVKTNMLIVTGGFSRNKPFLQLLAAFLPDLKIYTDKLSHASALGAAMVVQKNMVKGGSGFKTKLDLTLHSSPDVDGISGYKWRPEV